MAQQHHPTIRSATPEDLAQVLALQQQWAAEEITYGFVAGSMEEIAASLTATFLLAVIAEEIVGYITASPHLSEGMAVIPPGVTYLEIDDLYVTPARRGQGIGHALVAAVLAKAEATGIDYQLVYSATKDIHRILAFYEESGFTSWYMQLYRTKQGKQR